MNEELLNFVEENDVKFVRLAFCDIAGRLKNVSVMAEALEHVLQDGMAFDASLVEGFPDAQGSDLLLQPDPATMAILPWRPQQGRVARCYCNVLYADGRPFESDVRRLLRGTVRKLAELGFAARISLECEFYLFRLDDQGQPILAPHDQAGYLDFAPLDRGENVRREICLSLEQMGIAPMSSHHEAGPGQNEIGLFALSPLAMADGYISFCNAARTVAARYGLFASFLPKPLKENFGSGLHLSISLYKDGENIVKRGDRLSPEAASFLQGILSTSAELSAFLNPLPGSYERLGCFDAPKEVAWSYQNRAMLARVPADKGAFARLELRNPDPSMNPYLCFALLLEAGLRGIAQGLELCPENKPCGSLPSSLQEAVRLAEGSQLIREVLPKSLLSNYLSLKERQFRHMYRAEDPQAYELSHFFPWA